MDVFKILAAILHLGNVQITAVGNERSAISVSGLLVPPCLRLEGHGKNTSGSPAFAF